MSKITPIDSTCRVNDKPVGKCPKCGLTLYAVMMYYCARKDCGAGLGSRIEL